MIRSYRIAGEIIAAPGMLVARVDSVDHTVIISSDSNA